VVYLLDNLGDELFSSINSLPDRERPEWQFENASLKAIKPIPAKQGRGRVLPTFRIQTC
jgi:hypothetical protein